MDVAYKKWIMPDLSGNGPDAREGHTAVLAGKQLFIFGGCGKSENDEEQYFNDLYILDIGNIFLSLIPDLGCHIILVNTRTN